VAAQSALPTASEKSPSTVAAHPSEAATHVAAPTVVPSPLSDGSDPSVGMFFTDLPEVSGNQAHAAEALMQFEVEFWRSMTSGKVSAALEHVAAPDVVQMVKNQVDGNNGRRVRTSGTASDAFAHVAGAKKVVVFDVCNNLDHATFTKGVKQMTGPEAGFEPAIIRMEVGETEKGWRVQSYDQRGGC